MTTPNGQTTQVKLDSARRISRVIGPLTNPWTATYSNNALQSEVAPTGSTTTYVNDGTPPNVIAKITPEGRTSFTYITRTRRVQSITDPLGHRTTLIWNSTGQITTRINPLNQRTTTVYDSGARPVAVINPLVARSTNIFQNGLMAATINPLGLRTTVSYNVSGQRIRTKSPLHFCESTSMISLSGSFGQSLMPCQRS